MAWFKVDDGLHSSRKFLSIPKRARFAAVGLWTVAGSWCADELTDGHVPDYMLDVWGAPPSAHESLVNAGLWERESGGYLFCNWHEYQPSKQDVDAERAASRERMRELRARRKQVKAQKDAEESEMFGVTSPNGSESVRNPDPTRPDPTHIEVSKDTSPSGETKLKETRLPADWAPTKSHYDLAQQRNVDIQAEVEAFRLHAETHDRHAARWNTAFTTWLKKSKPRPARVDPDAWMNPSRREVPAWKQG